MIDKTDRETIFVVKVPAELGTSVGPLLAGLVAFDIQVAASEQGLWLRYQVVDGDQTNRLRCLPGQHFRLLDADRLVRLNETIATESLPVLEWQDLSDVIDWKLPPAAMSGRLRAICPTNLRLVSSGIERSPVAGLYKLTDIKEWVESAPEFRLAALSACVTTTHLLVLSSIAGQKTVPLPPIECSYLCRDGDLLTPAGQTWYPRIASAKVLELFDTPAMHLLLWSSDDCWSYVPLDHIRPLRRASFRAYVAASGA